MKNWFTKLAVILKKDFAIVCNLFITGAAWVMAIGLIYFFAQLMFSGNVWQSLLSFGVGATVSAIIISLLVTAHNSDDNMYEVAVANLQKQLKDAGHNNDLMRLANQSLQKDKDILNADVNRQAKIIADLATKNLGLYIDLDMAKAKLTRLNIGTSQIDEKGKIV